MNSGSEAQEMLLTGYQLAAAMALVGLKRTGLAKLAKVSEDAISSMEASKAHPIGAAANELQAVRSALEACGVEFLNHGQPGVD
jgi:hypothetical protein